MSWSRLVHDPVEVAQALADPGDALDLRATAALDDAWRELGFYEVAPGELARPLDVVLPTVADTEALGHRLAGDLRAGDLVLLSGPLGAGKTALARGLGAGLGVRGPVTSPTFVLARRHEGPVPMVHVDAYRLRDGPIDLDDLDLDAGDAVTVVEWGEGLAELAGPRLHVVLHRGGILAVEGSGTMVSADESRLAQVTAQGGRWSVVQPPRTQSGNGARRHYPLAPS